MLTYTIPRERERSGEEREKGWEGRRETERENDY
jgi:hypothetical protein